MKLSTIIALVSGLISIIDVLMRTLDRQQAIAIGKALANSESLARINTMVIDAHEVSEEVARITDAELVDRLREFARPIGDGQLLLNLGDNHVPAVGATGIISSSPIGTWNPPRKLKA